MAKLVVSYIFASVLIIQMTAQGGANSQSIPGYRPVDYVRAVKPQGDDRPNDVYAHLALRRPVLTSEEIVIYPHHFGFEYGQDPENSIYEITNAKELVAKHGKHHKHGKKNGKQHIEVNNRINNEKTPSHAHEHIKDLAHGHEPDQPEETLSAATENIRQFRPRPSFSTSRDDNSNNIHPHFG